MTEHIQNDDHLSAAPQENQALRHRMWALQAHLQALEKRQHNLLHLLSHELRNPLMPIINAAQILNLSKTNPEMLDWAGSVVKRQSKRLLRLLDNLLDLARLADGTLAMERGQVELQAVLAESISLLHADLAAQNQQLQVTQPDAAVLIVGDFTRLSQALEQLLDYSHRHTPPGGRISLTLVLEADMAHVIIEDDGGELDAAVFKHLFDDRLADITPEPCGLGMGLYLARRLIERHGGNVIATQLVEGLRLSMKLPRLLNTIE